MPKLGDSVDRYVIEAVIGEGGMGRVYRALDPRLGRRVALKVLLAEGTDRVRADAAARMIREARAAAAFNHPNVVAIHDVGEIDGSPYITMELVTGHTLRTLAAEAASSDATKLSWLLDVARGLAAAHRAGLVHRDIKPDNVMVTTDGVVKILDFGIARRADTESPEVDVQAQTAAAHLPSLTAEGHMIGTPQYMAPEQLRGDPLDGRCDQFAWGVMAWELFTGRSPWGNTSNPAMLVTAVLATPARALRDVLPGVATSVNDAVARALEKNRDARFVTMDDLLSALQRKDAPSTPTPSRRELSALATTATAEAVASPSTEASNEGAAPEERPRTTGAVVSEAPTPGVVGRRSSVGGDTRTDPDLRGAPRRGVSWIPLLAMAVLVVGAAWVAFGIRRASTALPDGRAVGTSSVPLLGPAQAAPLVGPCDVRVKNNCSAGSKAWCDVDGQTIACCAIELVAIGRDGVCGCPPGGTILDTSACPRATGREEGGVPNAGELISALRPKFRACYNQALEASASLEGRMLVSVEVAPDGRVFRARIQEGRMASPLVQTCTLDVLRQARFAPPPGGSAGITVPISFDTRGSAAVEPRTEPGIRGRHPCKAKGSCAEGATAWCDTDENDLACCANGFVAVGRDGMCECSPGGSAHDAGGCPSAKTKKADYDRAFGKIFDDSIGPAQRCMKSADAGCVAGSVSFAVDIDPDGVVYNVRIMKGAIPEVVAQRCLLDEFRSLRLAPPPDGFYHDKFSIDFGCK